MALGTVIYNALFKRTSTLILTVAVGAFAFEAAVDGISESIFNTVNQGKLWEHIKDKYSSPEE